MTDLKRINGRVVMPGADLGGADLRGAMLHLADLRGAMLHLADLRGAMLHDADLSGTTLPAMSLAELVQLIGASMQEEVQL